MKLIGAALAVAVISAASVLAQSSTTTRKETRKIEVTGGELVKVVGCLMPGTESGYMLTSSSGGLKYVLVTDRDLSKHVGQLVEVKGRAADLGDGKVKVESKLRTNDSEQAKETTEVRSNPDLRYLGLKSFKKLSSSCE